MRVQGQDATAQLLNRYQVKYDLAKLREDSKAPTHWKIKSIEIWNEIDFSKVEDSKIAQIWSNYEVINKIYLMENDTLINAIAKYIKTTLDNSNYIDLNTNLKLFTL